MAPGSAFKFPLDAIADFCQRFNIRELAVFGSVLRDDFGPDSDIDVIVTFADGAEVGLLAFARIQRELASILGRPVDLSTRAGIEEELNVRRRDDIIASAHTIYAAA